MALAKLGFKGTGGRAARFAFRRLLRWDREFQKYFDHAAWRREQLSLAALARLGLARAYSISGDTARAKAAYNFESAPALFSLFAKNLVAGPAFVFEHLVRDPGLIFGHDPCGSSIPDKLRACQHALDTKELADILQVSKIWILRKVKNRTIPHFKDGKILRFDPRLIADWWDKKSKR